jgi:hypothetical protein
MKLLFSICLFYLSIALLAQQPTSGTELFKIMHTKFYQGPCRSYTFSQKNTHYRNDSIVGNSVWHEAVEFPDKFRINFGDRENKNCIIFKNDSAFNYKSGKLVKQRIDTNTLLLLLGGMYYRSIEDVLSRIKKADYNLNTLSAQKWKNEEVYVIGAKENDLTSNQVWINKKDLRVIRIIEKIKDGEMMDMRFESYQPWCKGFVETKVSFRRNGKLEQMEEYYDIKECTGFSE